MRPLGDRLRVWDHRIGKWAAGGGWVTLLAGGAALVLVLGATWLERAGWLWAHRLELAIALGLVALLVCLLYLTNIDRSELFGLAHPGWGLYLTLVSSISLIVSVYLLRAQQRAR